jgi:uncharacterized protein (DUF934 family)
MPTLIDRRGRRHDDWVPHDGDPALAPADAALLVPLATWKAHAQELTAREAPVGVLLATHDDPAAIAGALDRLALIAVDFPKFTDGRGYSIARLLRERHGWRGELRATGEVLRDQLFYLVRCGFDSFALADGEDAGAALTHFSTFSDAYQAAADRGPLFLRRPATMDLARVDGDPA